MLELRKALLNARERTGDNTLATSVKRGKFRIERVAYNERGVSRVVPVTDFVPMNEVLGALAAL